MHQPALEELEPQFTYTSIDKLLAHPQNYKEHPQAQLNELKASLLRFGQVKPVVVQKSAGIDDYMILAGHGLTMAAQQLIEEHPANERIQRWRAHWAIIIAPATWTAVEARAYMVADNELSVKAVTDEEKLVSLLEEQRSAGTDLSSMGFNEADLDNLFAKLADCEENEGDGLLPIAEDNERDNASVDYMTFDGIKVPLSGDELKALKARYNDYCDLIGNKYGFVRSLLDV